MTISSLPPERVLQMFKDCGALLEGHFVLSSGLHSGHYLQCARLLMEPRRAETVCATLAARIAPLVADRGIQAVVSPALGGIVFGYELARQLGLPSMFVERTEGQFALRRGFELASGAPVLLAEDVVTTGLSSRECAACVAAHGGQVVAAACLVDRSNGQADLGVPLTALAVLELPTYPADQLPSALASLPAVKPGSRQAVTGG